MVLKTNGQPNHVLHRLHARQEKSICVTRRGEPRVTLRIDARTRRDAINRVSTNQRTKQFSNQQTKNEKKMTEDSLMEALNLKRCLDKARENQLLFQREHVSFDQQHWDYPWNLFTDEEWMQMMDTIKERTDQRVADLEAKFAAL